MNHWFSNLIVAMGILIIPIIWAFAFMGLGWLLITSIEVNLGDYIQGVVLFTLNITIWVTLAIHWQNKKYTQSDAFLNHAINLAHKAHDVLQENNQLTENITAWVSAARLIQRSIELRKLLTLPAHQIIYDSEHDLLRHKFTKLLSLDAKRAGPNVTFLVGANVNRHLEGNGNDELRDCKILTWPIIGKQVELRNSILHETRYV